VVISCQAKLHFLTGSSKNIYQLATEFFSIKKDGNFGRLAINQISFNPSEWWGGFT
jgi:hypothetical protein